MADCFSPVRIGIVGTNFISDWLVEAAKLTESCTFSAVCSRSIERADSFADKHDISHRFNDYSAFLSCDEVDVVYIATPNSMHYPQAIQALKSGKHVLCEKPLALNEKQANAMIALAKENGLVLLEAIRPLFDPYLRIIKENLPRLGRICRATFEYCQYSSRNERYKAGEYVNIFNPALGNAALYDLGVYCMHCCAYIFGEPKRIFSASSFLETGVEVAGTTLLDYGDVQANITYSKITHSAFPSIIQGENGTLAFDVLTGASYVKLLHRSGQEENLNSPWLGQNLNMVYELDAMAKCVHGEDDFERYIGQSALVLRVFDEMRRQLGVNFGPLEEL